MQRLGVAFAARGCRGVEVCDLEKNSMDPLKPPPPPTRAFRVAWLSLFPIHVFLLSHRKGYRHRDPEPQTQCTPQRSKHIVLKTLV